MHLKLTFIFLLVLNSNIKCFDPGNLEGMNFWSKDDRTHIDLTKCSLYKITYDLLSDQYSSSIDISKFGTITIDRGKCKNAAKLLKTVIKAVGLSWRDFDKAVETISESNRLVDIYEAFNTAAHFDDETFAQGARRISDLKYAAIEAVRKDDYVSSRRYVGQLFHTIQDFYSHSNWVEFEPKRINLKLGKSLNLGDVIDIAKRGCVSCDTNKCVSQIEKELIEKKILTSGYFSFLGSGAKKPLGKCSHGGGVDWSKDQDAVGGGINKDSLSSIHGDWHLNAANLAQLSTFEFLKDLWSIVGDQNFTNFLGFRGQSLVIVIDTTGSMQPSINAVKKTAIDLINNHQQSFNYILSPFNDPTWGPVTITKDKEYFAQKINALIADDGGDIPELYYHGLLDALKVCEPNSIVFTFTDAPAKDDYLREEVLSLALIKSAKVNSIVVGSSSKSSNQVDVKISEPLIQSRSTYGYDELASTTGGLSIFSNNIYIASISSLIITQQESQNDEFLLLMAETISSDYTNNFYVDQSIERLSFYISSSKTAPSYFIYDPNNSTNQNYTKVFDSGLTKFFYLEKPLKGTWTLKINSRDVLLKITCKSTIEAIVSLTMFNESLIHPGYVETGSSPLANSNLTVFSYVSQEIKNISIDVLTPHSKLIQQLTPKLTDSFTASANIITPSETFSLKLNAWLNDGSKVERFSSLMFTPTYFNLKFSSDQANQIKIGEEFSFKISVENQGVTSLARISVIDTLKLVNYNNEVTIESNSTFTESLKITIPNDENLNGMTNTIALSAGLKSTYLITNQETIFLTIQSKNVSFDLEPRCVILTDSRNTDCESKFSVSKFWNAVMLINETGSGLAQISSIKSAPFSESSVFNLTYDSFDYSSKEPIRIYLTADCSTQDIDVFVSDVYGNVDKCEFKSPEISFGISMHSSQTKAMITILCTFIFQFIFNQ